MKYLLLILLFAGCSKDISLKKIKVNTGVGGVGSFSVGYGYSSMCKNYRIGANSSIGVTKCDSIIIFTNKY